MLDRLQEELRQITALIDKRLAARTATREDWALRRVRRHLPYRMRRICDTLIAAEAALSHPRLARQLDERALVQKARRLRHYIDALDLADRRYGRRLDMAVSVFAALLGCGALLVVVLRWRGFL